MKPGVAARVAAARCVAAVLSGSTLDATLEEQLRSLEDRDRGLAREIASGTLRLLPRLDALLSLLLDRPFRRRDVDLRALALVGLYQLSRMRIPAHAAVSATVDGAAALRQRRATGLLNALLRRFQREEQVLLDALPEAARQAHPDWLWQALGRHWPDERASIVEANNRRPPMTLRVNAQRTTRENYLQVLGRNDLSTRRGGLSADALTLETPVDVHRLPGFDEGLCSVQDEAAQCAARLLQPASGERILDACAAPGGKSGHIKELEAGARLTAMDISGERLERVRQNLLRLGVEATLLTGDATAPPDPLGKAAFEAILADVPCSASGVIRRHPDIKALRRADDIAGFAALQGRILDGLWPLLAPGGRLLYVTCSVLPAENSDVVEAFLARRPDAMALPLALAGARACPRGLQLLPAADGGDGLFFSLLGKPRDS